MNILVTGGAGYIGSHTVRELLARGHRVVIVDLEPDRPSGRWSRRCDQHRRGRRATRDRLTERPPRRGRSRASSISPDASSWPSRCATPAATSTSTSAGSLSVLGRWSRPARRRSCSRRAAPSTARRPRTPPPRTCRSRPENPYGASKMIVEQMLGWFGRIHGIRSVSLRYFNAAGASFDGRARRATADAR